MLEPITRYISGGIIKDRILGTFSKLGELDQIREPKFVFAHIVCPHYPYVFKANGDPVEVKLLTFAKGLTQSEDRELYLNQLIFVNKKVKTLVKGILLKLEVSPIDKRFQQRQEVFDRNAREYTAIKMELLTGKITLDIAVDRFNKIYKQPTEAVIRRTL